MICSQNEAEILNRIATIQQEQVAMIHNIIRETKSMYQGHAAVIAELALEVNNIDLLLTKAHMLNLLQYNPRLDSIVTVLK